MTRAELQKEWETLIAEYRASGQSAKEWCAANDVKPERLWYWLRSQKTKENGPFMKSTRWLPVAVSEQSPMEQGNSLLIRVGVACIEVKPGFDPALLSEIVRVLATSC
jgi:hypothetical protein